MDKFHTHNIKAYPHQTLNTSKGAVRCQDLWLCTIEEIKKELKCQGVIEVKRATVKKEEKNNANTDILSFNMPKIPEKIKISYTTEKVGQ